MIATTVVEEVRRMLREGRLSQRNIALRVGISRGTVNAIALDRRPDRPRRSPRGGDDFIPPAGLPRRCPDCGGIVQMPCLLCYLRARRRRELASAPTPSG